MFYGNMNFCCSLTCNQIVIQLLSCVLQCNFRRQTSSNPILYLDMLENDVFLYILGDIVGG
jgi:hypothetical protein